MSGYFIYEWTVNDEQWINKVRKKLSKRTDQKTITHLYLIIISSTVSVLKSFDFNTFHSDSIVKIYQNIGI